MQKQQLQLKLKQRLSPQQIQVINLVQLSTEAFEEKIKQELEENEALEEYSDSVEETSVKDLENQELSTEDYLDSEDMPSERLGGSNYYFDRSVALENPISLQQYLKNQLQLFDLKGQSKIIAEFLIGSIDDSGYIRFSIQEILDDLAFNHNIIATHQEVENIFKNVIHQLDPIGIGARNLQECLIVQLSHFSKSKEVELAIEIIQSSFDLFTKKHYDKIIQKHHVDKEILKSAFYQIEQLSPKPSIGYSNNNKITEYIVPDFVITIENGELLLDINSGNIPSLYVSRKYKEIIEGYSNPDKTSKNQKEALMFVQQKLESAKNFIEAVKQRRQTLLVTVKAIMNYQKAYFLTGDEKKLEPMILKDIANVIEMDMSIVSRVVNSKYVDTPYGIKKLKFFFSEGINIEGEDVSSIKIKSILKEVVDEENKQLPFTDEKLVEILTKKGFPVARRTVAKYRKMLNIPVARLRKSLV